MALVTGKLRMYNVGGQNLHPFFTQTKVQNSHQSADGTDSSPRLPAELITPPGHSPLRDAIPLPQPRRRRNKASKRRSTAVESGVLITAKSPAEAALEGEKSNPVKRYEMEVINQDIVSDRPHIATGLEPDLNGNRRKRQRTVSPSQEALCHITASSDAWQEQLTAAAFGDDPDNATEPKYLPLSPVQLEGPEATWKEANGITPLQETNACKLLPGQPLANAPRNEFPSTNAPESALLQKAQRTPPKKMLKVRSDGKLTSPKSENTEIIPGQNRKGHPRQAKAKPQKWVVFRFGVDAASRRIIAQKANQAPSGPVNKPCRVSGLNSAKTSLKAQALVGPPKPTHPFFLGSSAQHTNPKMLIPLKDEDKTAGAKHGEIAAESDIDEPTDAKPVVKPKLSTRAWAAFGSFGSKSLADADWTVARTQGAQEPLWPCRGMSHVRGLVGPSMPQIPDSCKQLAVTHKLKEVKISIVEQDDILYPLTQTVNAYRHDTSLIYSHGRETLGRHGPKRRVMTGRQLQRAICPRMYHPSTRQTQSPQATASDKNGVDDFRFSVVGLHPVIRRTYEKIAHSLTAFDKGECESQEWAQKYAPKCAADVLQRGREVMLLRDWLQTLQVNSVSNCLTGNGKIRRSSDISKRPSKSLKRRKKRAEDLDGFLITSDDDADEMEELSDMLNVESGTDSHSQSKRSIVRTGCVMYNTHSGEHRKSTNAVVVSGPHGCGKTAAIYAVSEELGFEVFEINAGSRRNGKDLMERVGEMSQNHLVHRARNNELAANNISNDDGVAEEETIHSSEGIKRDLASGRQGTMKSFFQPKKATKKDRAKATVDASRIDTKKSWKGESTKRQSLVLLEEVDVLFEEDKQFWAATLDFLLQSKRPIVMTCTDESLLPLDQMRLHAIFRFSAAPKELAIDYLLLVAANEGHLLSRDAVSILYQQKKHDLRASIVELNFFCQMAVGDKKGGLEWMLIRSSSDDCRGENGEQLRIVSEGTYRMGMSMFGCNCADFPSGATIEQETDLIAAAWNDWEVDLDDCLDCSSFARLPQDNPPSRQARISTLKTFENVADSLSATDTFPGFGFRRDLTTTIDPSFPELTEKIRENFDLSATLINANPMVEQSQMGASLASTVRACANRTFAHDYHGFSSFPVAEAIIVNNIVKATECRPETMITRSGIRTPFDPIARPTKGSNISSFDGPMSMVMEDLAPYVRGIVYYDIRLEEQRHRLSSLLSEGVRNGKKTRTTRASRAALEGGSKAYTRRERWFPKETNFTHVLESGGKDWREIFWHETAADSLDGELGFDRSRRSSMVSGTGSEI